MKKNLVRFLIKNLAKIMKDKAAWIWNRKSICMENYVKLLLKYHHY